MSRCFHAAAPVPFQHGDGKKHLHLPQGARSPFTGDHSGWLLAAQLHHMGVFELFGALFIWPMQARAWAAPSQPPVGQCCEGTQQKQHAAITPLLL